MHMYQKHILDLLRKTPSLHYADLQPDGVESSHFKYHLDQLLKDDLVIRLDRGVYSLSEAGKMAVDRLSENRINPKLTPKVITYTLLRDDDYYYLQRKNKQPFLGLVNLVAGKVHLDESTHDAAIREVDEKTGLVATNLTHHSVAEVRIHENSELISHFVAYVFSANFDGDVSQLVKVAPADVDRLEDKAPDLDALLAAITRNTSFIDLDLTI